MALAPSSVQGCKVKRQPECCSLSLAPPQIQEELYLLVLRMIGDLLNSEKKKKGREIEDVFLRKDHYVDHHGQQTQHGILLNLVFKRAFYQSYKIIITYILLWRLVDLFLKPFLLQESLQC